MTKNVRGRMGERDSLEESGLQEHVVKINRCATVVKGGRRFSFSALVVVGDGMGQVGIGFGKAKAVPSAVDKAIKNAKKQLVKISLKDHTISHEVVGRFGASNIKLLPARPGTGVIASNNVRMMLELVGIKDVLSKSFGSTNPINLTRATLHALQQLRPEEDVVRLRGVGLS